MPNAMFGSQTLIAGGSFHQQNIHQHTTVFKDPFDRLLDAASPAAFHNFNDVHDPPKCHPNTRVAILDNIMEWIRGLDLETRDALVMWLYGPAGSGKSAIARSIAERCYEGGILVASYFFSRSDVTRNHGRSLIATIAYQASICFPDIRDHIIQIIDLDPFIFTRSLDAQLLTLIIKPLQQRIKAGCFDAVTAPRVVIIDGLDECEGRETQVKILTTISRVLQEHRLPLIFVVASRPEHDIMRTFDVGYLKEITSKLALNDDYLPSNDIRLFLEDKFTEIKDTHPFKGNIPPRWPSPEVLQSLVDKSSGQFIYASTVVKFIASSRHLPHLRLEIALGLRPVHRDMPFAELDALYRQILSSAEDHEKVLRILALRFIPSRYEVTDIEKILSLNTGDISWLLCDLTSLISVEHFSFDSHGHWRELHISHASLQDFLFDYSRAQQFYISAPLLCAELAHLCIRCLQEGERSYFVAWSAVALLQNATPTQELHTDLTNLSFGSLLADCGNHTGIALFLTSIKPWKFDAASDLHGHQLRLFDQFAQGILEKMYPDTNLTALVAVAKMKIRYSHIRDGIKLFQLDKAQIALDKLSFSDHVYWNSKYQQFISEFLEDPNRSGIYALNGQRYATAALYFLSQISNYSEKMLPSWNKTTQRKCKRRINFPWLWRKLVQQARSSEAAQMVKWQLKRQERLTPYRLYRSELAFLLALECLIHVLPKSDGFEELTAMVRQQKIGRLLLKNTREKKATREIARYMARIQAKDPSRE